MPVIARAEILAPKRLSSAELGALTGALYRGHREILGGAARGARAVVG